MEPNVLIANEVHDAVQVDDTDHVEFDLDELKEQLGIGSILKSSTTLMQSSVAEKLGLSTLVERLKIQRPLQKPPKAAVVLREVASTNEPHEEEFKLLSVFEEINSFGPEVAEVIAERVNDACSKRAMESNLKDLFEKYKTPANCKYLCVPKVKLELWHDLS